MTTRHTRLIARFAIAGALALGLAGGIASVASAAPAPSDTGRIDGPVGPGPGAVNPGLPTTTTTRVPVSPVPVRTVGVTVPKPCVVEPGVDKTKGCGSPCDLKIHP